MRRNSKYHSAKAEVDGIIFDSRKEAKRYLELKELGKAGKIQNLQRQVRYTLIPSQYESKWNPRKATMEKGKCLERQCDYVADFVYWDNDLDCLVVEDTKGMRTKDYVIKRKLMLWVHHIRIREV